MSLGRALSSVKRSSGGKLGSMQRWRKADNSGISEKRLAELGIDVGGQVVRSIYWADLAQFERKRELGSDEESESDPNDSNVGQVIRNHCSRDSRTKTTLFSRSSISTS